MLHKYLTNEEVHVTLLLIMLEWICKFLTDGILLYDQLSNSNLVIEVDILFTCVSVSWLR